MEDRVVTTEASRWSFPERLKHARQQGGYSTREMSKLLGVRQETVLSWETGRTSPRANRLPVLAGTLNISIRWLLSGQGDMPQSCATRVASKEAEDMLNEVRRLKQESDRSVRKLVGLERRLSAMLSEIQ